VLTVGRHVGPYAAGTRTEPQPHFVVASVRETRRAARFDTDDPADADLPAIMRDWCLHSAVASPVVVEGELWGAIVIASRRSLPPLSSEGAPFASQRPPPILARRSLGTPASRDRSVALAVMT
jgi:hypothetical protein